MKNETEYYMTLAISRVEPETPVILDAPDEIIQVFDGFFCEDNSFKDTWFKKTPLEPGVYHCKVAFYFEQGYFEGYKADGESDWEFVVLSAEQKIGFGNPPKEEHPQ
jgi:hypothetical protein